MATETVTRTPQRPEALPAHRWHNLHPNRPCTLPAASVADFAATVKDIASGLGVVTQMLERDTLDAQFNQDDGTPMPGLSEGDADALRRLTVSTAELLAREAEAMLGKLTGNESWDEQAQPPKALRVA